LVLNVLGWASQKRLIYIYKYNTKVNMSKKRKLRTFRKHRD